MNNRGIQTSESRPPLADTPSTPTNLMPVFIGGLIGAVIGGVLLAIIMAKTELNPWFLALGVGILAGAGVRSMVRQRWLKFRIFAAILTVLAAMTGTIGGIYLETNQQWGIFAARFMIFDYVQAMFGTIDSGDIGLLGIALFLGFGVATFGLKATENDEVKSTV